MFSWGYLPLGTSDIAPVLVVILDGTQILRASVCGIDQPEFDGTKCDASGGTATISTFDVFSNTANPLLEFNWIFPAESSTDGIYGALSGVSMTIE